VATETFGFLSAASCGVQLWVCVGVTSRQGIDIFGEVSHIKEPPPTAAGEEVQIQAHGAILNRGMFS
jgi:hypothetical protein